MERVNCLKSKHHLRAFINDTLIGLICFRFIQFSCHFTENSFQLDLMTAINTICTCVVSCKRMSFTPTFNLLNLTRKFNLQFQFYDCFRGISYHNCSCMQNLIGGFNLEILQLFLLTQIVSDFFVCSCYLLNNCLTY